MEIITLSIITAVIGFGIVIIKNDLLKSKNNIGENTYNNIHTPRGINLSDSQEYYIGNKCIGLYSRKGYEKYPIAGVYYRNLPISTVGKFNGYVSTEQRNGHDKYAIAVYTDSGVHLGYIPKNNRKLHSYILNNNDNVHAYGYIGCYDDGGMYGEVCVETDKSLVTKRNKPYSTI